jgi:hypothetical protein
VRKVSCAPNADSRMTGERKSLGLNLAKVEISAKQGTTCCHRHVVSYSGGYHTMSPGEIKLEAASSVPVAG